jgi:hypothetical protein
VKGNVRMMCGGTREQEFCEGGNGDKNSCVVLYLAVCCNRASHCVTLAMGTGNRRQSRAAARVRVSLPHVPH